MRTIVYIDGFNLYYLRLRKRGDLKWLNLFELAKQIVDPKFVISRVNYYTARVSGKIDPSAPARQQAYLDALATVPEVAVHYGAFLFSEKWAYLVKPPQAKPANYVWPATLPDLVWVAKTEEKGSDVNLASHLVRDACLGKFDAAMVLSNDTDLVEPIRIVAKEIGKPVGLISPAPNKKINGRWRGPHINLVKAASFTIHLHNGALARSQFPSLIPGTTISRPPSWV